MPTMMITRSIEIEKKPEEIYRIINDFHHWKPWSPWLILEKEVKVNVREDGKYYKWDGNLVGSGEMTVLNEVENESISYDLTFLKPWKSRAKVGFSLEPNEYGTRVNWSMESKLPWFMFWMKNMMTGFISMDYDRGLQLLKDYAEDGQVHSQLEIVGEKSIESCNYIGIERTCDLNDLGANHKADFTQLMEFTRKHDLVDGNGFTIYHKWDVANGKCHYTACVPVKNKPENLPSSFVSGQRNSSKVHTIKHIGPYHHLGNAWSAQMNRQRGKVFKANKKLHPVEEYVNSPQDASELELVTEIHIPIV